VNGIEWITSLTNVNGKMYNEPNEHEWYRMDNEHEWIGTDNQLDKYEWRNG